MRQNVLNTFSSYMLKLSELHVLKLTWLCRLLKGFLVDSNKSQLLSFT